MYRENRSYDNHKVEQPVFSLSIDYDDNHVFCYGISFQSVWATHSVLLDLVASSARFKLQPLFVSFNLQSYI